MQWRLGHSARLSFLLLHYRLLLLLLPLPHSLRPASLMLLLLRTSRAAAAAAAGGIASPFARTAAVVVALRVAAIPKVMVLRSCPSAERSDASV